MRYAPLALLAACSSPATTTTTHPGDDVYVSLDAAPAEPVAEAWPDAEPWVPCLSLDHHPVAIDGESVVMCTDEGADPVADPVSCEAIAPDGTFGDVAAPAAPTTVVYTDNERVHVCPAGGTCVELAPKLGEDDRLRFATLDPPGAQLALVIEQLGDGDDRLEVWDLKSAKRVATAAVKHGKAVQPNYEITYLGDAMLLTYDLDSRTEEGALWKLRKTKLKLRGKLEGDVKGWAAIDTKRAAFVLGDKVAVVSLATGKPITELDWTKVIPDPDMIEVDPSTELAIAADADEVVVVATNPAWDGDRGVGVFPVAGGSPRIYPVRSCGPVPQVRI